MLEKSVAKIGHLYVKSYLFIWKHPWICMYERKYIMTQSVYHWLAENPPFIVKSDFSTHKEGQNYHQLVLNSAENMENA